MFIVELRHTTGCIFDDNKKPLSITDELALIDEIHKEVASKAKHPFELTLIIVSYKLAGLMHVNKMLDHIKEGKKVYPHLISGYDMVNEEEYTKEIKEFMPEVLAA